MQVIIADKRGFCPFELAKPLLGVRALLSRWQVRVLKQPTAQKPQPPQTRAVPRGSKCLIKAHIPLSRFPASRPGLLPAAEGRAERGWHRAQPLAAGGRELRSYPNKNHFCKTHWLWFALQEGARTSAQPRGTGTNPAFLSPASSPCCKIPLQKRRQQVPSMAHNIWRSPFPSVPL